MSILQSVFYGLISGLSELMPISSEAHQILLRELFGAKQDPVMDMLIHLAVLAALYFGARNLMDSYQREGRLLARRTNSRSSQKGYMHRFVRSAGVVFVALLLVFTYVGSQSRSLLTLSLFCLINGVILFVPERMMQSNKDARYMTLIDSILFGLLGALSVFPGLSRIGLSTAYATARGTDRQHGLSWALLLSIPAMILLALFDFITIFTAAPAISFVTVVGYILGVGAAFLGGYYSITIMKFLAVRAGYTAFAFYSWGMALFSFVLYLI